MRHHDDNALKLIQIILQSPQGRNVKIIGRLVKDQHIRRTHKHLQKIQPPSLAARELSEQTILILSRKQKAFQHLRRTDLSFRRIHKLRNVADIVYHALAGLHFAADLLCVIADLHGLAELDVTAVRRDLSGNHLHKSRFSAAVRPYEADAVILPEQIGKIAYQHPVAICLADMLQLNCRPAKPCHSGCHLDPAVLLRSFPALQLLKPVQTRLLLGRSRLRSPPYPCQFVAQDALTLPLARLRHLLALHLQFQIALIIRFIGIDTALIDLDDTVGHAVEEIPVMCYHDDSALALFQHILQPVAHHIVQMVCRLIQHENLRRRQQHGHQRQTLALPAGKLPAGLSELRDSQPCQHRFRVRLDIARIALCPVAAQNSLQNRLLIIELRVLRQETDHAVVGCYDFPLIRLLNPCNHLQQRRFPGSVDADDSGFLALLQIKARIGK